WNRDNDDECEPDGCSEHGFQRELHAREQFQWELCEVHGYGDRVHDHGDAGSGSGWLSAGTREWHSDRAASNDNARLHDIGESEHADGYRGQCHDVHDQHRSIKRVHWGGDAQCERVAGGGDSEFFTRDGDGVREFDVDGDHDGEHADGDVDVDDHGDEWKFDAYDDGEFGCECTSTTAGLYGIGESEHADGDSRQCGDVHDDDRSVERVWRGGDAQCERIADGGDGELFAGDGDGSRKLDVDSGDGGEHAGGDVDLDDHGDERECDAHGDGDADGDGGRERSDQHRFCGARDSHGEYGGGWGGGEGELEQCQRADEYDGASVGG